MERIVVDVITGETNIVPLTPEEEAAVLETAASLQAAAEAAQEAANSQTVIPESITRPQAAKQLLYMGYITDDEALAMAQSGIAPAFVRQHINTDLPAPDRVPALIDFTRYTYDRNHPLLLAMVAANGFSTEEVDHFFMQAATL